MLVPESHAMGSLACIRSLGRAGHTVIAMSEKPNAIGFYSKFCHSHVLVPRLSSHEAAAFSGWLMSLVEQRDISFIIPSEGLLTSLGEEVQRFAMLLPLGRDPECAQRYMKKFELFKTFLATEDETRDHLPETHLIEHIEEIEHVLQTLTPPIFVKLDASVDRGFPAQVKRFDSKKDAALHLPHLLTDYSQAVAQEYVPGEGVGVFFLRWNGRFRAVLMHRRLHEVPHTGGVSSYRETWWHDKIAADALRRAALLDWWGVGMFEYRWEPRSDRFWLIEFNGRFWGSLHLALFAGVDFPLLLLDEWAGKVGASVRGQPGVKCRYTFPKEVEYLWSVLKDSLTPPRRKVRAVAEFCFLSLNPSVHSDLWFPGDRALYARSILETARKFLT